MIRLPSRNRCTSLPSLTARRPKVNSAISACRQNSEIWLRIWSFFIGRWLEPGFGPAGVGSRRWRGYLPPSAHWVTPHCERSVPVSNHEASTLPRFPPRHRAAVASRSALRDRRAQGMPRAQCARSLACKMKKRCQPSPRRNRRYGSNYLLQSSSSDCARRRSTASLISWSTKIAMAAMRCLCSGLSVL